MQNDNREPDLRIQIVSYIKQDLKILSDKELGKVYKYIRRLILNAKR
jgi:hypothetical protein